MEIHGKVVAIDLNAQIAKKDGRTYPGATFSYRDKDNKLREKSFHVNALTYNAAVKNGLENLQAGDNFIAEAEKNDGGFWEWKTLAKGESAPQKQVQPYSKSPTSQNGNGNWATAEERAQTQVYIVRQSSLTNALKLLELQGNKKAATIWDVISVAQEFEAYVLNKTPKELTNLGKATPAKNDNPFEDLEDDIPV